MSPVFDAEPALGADDFIDLLHRSGLARRRPVDDPARIARMLAGSDIVLTARDGGGRLIGIARSVTDWSYCCYLSDLAVDRAWQRRGIGRELIRRTHVIAGPETALILLAAPQARGYYPHIGLERHEHAYIAPGRSRQKGDDDAA